jgi:hypothetical protein
MATVIAYGTDKQGYYDLFIESCKRNQIEPVILGWGEKWIGFGKKVMAIRDYIKNLPVDEIVISVDPFDVIFLSNLEEIESKFRQMTPEFICGALKLQAFNEKVYNLEFNRTQKNMPRTPTNYNYLNTGTWISSAGYACKLIDDLEKINHMTETTMDQQLLTSIYIADKSVVDIDWKCEIFHNILFKDFISRRPDLTDIKFIDTRIQNTATGSTPCVLHASGNTHMKAIALRLGYNKQTLIPVNDNLNYSRKAFFHIHQLLKRALN